MKRTVSLLLVVAMLFGLSMMQVTGFAEEKKVVKYSIADDPQEMDPTLNSFSRSSIVLQNLFQGLYKLGPDGVGFIPACAESVQVSEDGMSYTFTLKKGLKWSDGSDLTAKDFEYSWKRVLNPAVASSSASDLWVLKNGKEYNEGTLTADDVGVKAIDDVTLEVQTAYYAPWFVTLTATTVYFPVKQSVVEAAGDPWTKNVATYVSNGAFMLTEYSSLDKLVMSKNPNYQGKDDVQIDEVIFYIIADPSAVLVAYDNGELNVADDINADARKEYAGTEQLVPKDRIGIQYWDFNCKLPEFSDPRVRQAFSYAIDRKAVLGAVNLTSETPVYGFVPSSQPSLTADGSYRSVAGDMFAEDVAKAQALLADAGYAGGAGFPVVNIVCQNNDEQKLMAQILGEMWKGNLGIQYTITTYESSTYWDELANGNFSVGRNGFTTDYLDPSSNLKVWVTGSNCSENGWDDPVFDKMVADASLILDPAQREAALIAAEQYICEQMPGMPMYTMVDDYLIKPELKGVIKNAIGHIYFEYAKFEG